LVEDNSDDIDLLMRALKKNGLGNQIHVARDGEEALKYLYSLINIHAELTGVIPKIILLDLKLPKIDGVEVLRRIKSDSKLSKIPVIALTSSDEVKDIEACYKLGVNSYIVKPVDFEKFTQTINTLGAYWLLLNRAPLP